MYKADTSNTADVIDSRDIIARIAELEEGHASKLSTDELYELLVLQKLAEYCEHNVVDWEHGVGLVRDSYFKEYAQQLAEDCDLIKRDVAWPYTCIDWDWAVRELKHDYSQVDYDGVTYWARD